MHDEIHDLLRRSDWIRAYRATAEFFDRKLTASGEQQKAGAKGRLQSDPISVLPQKIGQCMEPFVDRGRAFLF